MYKVFIDGGEGTTGLRIYDRLRERPDIHIISIPETHRKSPRHRREAINSSEITFLCLPDDAARESVSLAGPHVKIIDASTAHRTEPGWAYGLPELSAAAFESVARSVRTAVPGCHAGGFIMLVRPLVEQGILPKDALLTCHSLTGYSGGGKSMIAQYEAGERDALLGAPRQYGLTQEHKHLKEMRAISGIDSAPLFCPIVADFYSGMEVTVPLFASQLAHGGIDDIRKLYQSLYTGPVVKYTDESGEGAFLSAGAMSGKDSAEIFVRGNEERILLVARFDNLGKGASGAAVECMNIMLGLDPTLGLTL